MSETMLKRGYRDSRVLIDAARVLDPQFSDGVLVFTGAQIEMMRNLTQYLGRRDTFVSEYHEQYYLIPDDADWDSLQSVVSDLEDILMGNPNVIFGYKDTYGQSLYDLYMGEGTNTQMGTVVPSGEMWGITGATAQTISSSVSELNFYAIVGGVNVLLQSHQPPVSGKWYQWQGQVYLKAGGRFFIQVKGATPGDDLYSRFWGYKMAV